VRDGGDDDIRQDNKETRLMMMTVQAKRAGIGAVYAGGRRSAAAV